MKFPRYKDLTCTHEKDGKPTLKLMSAGKRSTAGPLTGIYVCTECGYMHDSEKGRIGYDAEQEQDG